MSRRGDHVRNDTSIWLDMVWLAAIGAALAATATQLSV
jgi:hypothetical protein